MPINKSPLATSQVYRPSKQVVIESFEQGALVLRLADQHLIELNPIAASILALSDCQKSVAQIASALAKSHKISKKEICQDIKFFFKQLLDQGIVEPVRTIRRT